MPNVTIQDELAQRVNAAAAKYSVTPTQVVEGLIQTHLPEPEATGPQVSLANLAKSATKAKIAVGKVDLSTRCNALLKKEQQDLLDQWVPS